MRMSKVFEIMNLLYFNGFEDITLNFHDGVYVIEVEGDIESDINELQAENQ